MKGKNDQWIKWQEVADEWHQGEIHRISKTPGWFDVKFDLVLSGGGKTACFHLSRYMAERKVCWTSDGPPAGQTDSQTNNETASAAAAAAAEQRPLKQQRITDPQQQKQQQQKQQQQQQPIKGYYDDNGRLRFWMQLPVRECSSWCGCSRNCPNRVLQKGIAVAGITIQWMGKKGYGIITTEPLAAGTFIAEYAGQIKASESKSEDASNRFTLGLPGKPTCYLLLATCWLLFTNSQYVTLLMWKLAGVQEVN